MIETVRRQLEDKKTKSELSRIQNLNFAKSVNDRVSKEILAIEHKRELKHQQMVEMQEFLEKQRQEQSQRKKLSQKKMNEYEIGINR